MPKLVSEIASGQQFQRSSDEGRLADSQTRVFRILLNQPGEYINPQTACGITIGQRHPVNTNIFCTSWDIKYDGDSRTVVIATFNYQSSPASQGDDPKEFSPDVRPANWSTSTSLMEVPARTWRRIGMGNVVENQGEPVANTAGDMYDGVSRFEAVVTISIEQYCQNDPTVHLMHAGCVNAELIRLGSLQMQPGSVMFRGVQFKPTVESWGDITYRGWTASYEFAYRRNFVEGLYDPSTDTTYSEAIGWDLAIPQTGFNVICHLDNPNVEKAGMPLKHLAGKIENWPNGVALPTNVVAGQKARGMVLVHEYENGGASQLPCAQPIPLNEDGSPRIHTATPQIILKRWRANEMINFTNTFQLRLI